MPGRHRTVAGRRLRSAEFRGEFSAEPQRLIPHDRLIIACLTDDRRSFTVFAEHAANGPVLHASHYTTSFSPEGRYALGQGALAAMFGGGVLRLDELRDDYGHAAEGSVEHLVRDAGFRSALLLLLYRGGQVIGGLVASSLTPGTCSAAHAATGRQVADLHPVTILIACRRRFRSRSCRSSPSGSRSTSIPPSACWCSSAWSRRTPSSRSITRSRCERRGWRARRRSSRPTATLLATPVFYSLFDDAATRFAPRACLGRLFGRRVPRAVSADGFRS
jgi:hypothetical protein